MASIVLSDVLDELSQENKRLLNELLIADKCIKVLLEVKSFIDSIWEQISDNLDENQCKTYRELSAEAEDVINQVEYVVKPDEDVVKCDQLAADLFECYVCLKRFKSRSAVGRHHRHAHRPTTATAANVTTETNNQKSFECSICNMRFSFVSNTKRHLRNVHQICDRLDQLVVNHITGHSTDTALTNADKQPVDRPSLECSICQKRFHCKSNVNRHLKAVHGLTRDHTSDVENQSQTYVCDLDECGKEFVSEQKLRYHKMTVHCIRRRFTCDWPGCQYAVGWQCMLTKHKMVHSSDLQFVCGRVDCGKRFKASKYLKQHERVHNPNRPVTAERNFLCTHEGCAKAFTSKGNLRTHTVIAHLGIRHGCDWPGCEYSAGTKYHLKSHCIQIHGSERAFPCEWPDCGKRFKMKDKLKQHMKYHLNDKRHVCHWPGCMYRCVTAENLKIHIKTHVRQHFACDWPQCGQRFKSDQCLATHYKTHTE